MSEYTLYHGDCLELLSQLDNNSVDCCLLDLPYGVINKGNKHSELDRPIDINKIWIHLKRISKENAPFVFFCSGKFTYQILSSNFDDYKYSLVWDKCRTTGFLNAKKQPLRQHEDILIFYRKQPVYNPQFTKGNPSHIRGANANPENNVYGKVRMAQTQKYSDDKYPTSILKFEKNYHELNHPSEKPVELLRWLIRTYSNEGDVILDPTMGSGATGEASLLEKRKFIGIEKDKSWFDFAKKTHRRL